MRMLVDERVYQQPTVAAGAPAPSSSESAVDQSSGPPPQPQPLRFVPGDTEGRCIAAMLNQHLPPEVRVFAVQKVSECVSARCCAATVCKLCSHCL
jgi:hypothetical protein